MDLSFYGRFSSADHQRETSIEDQRRIVERWAAARGHTIVSEFTDYGTSGASFKVLKGLRRAVEAAGERPAPFAALVVDQLSRLSRDIGDTDVLVKRLKFYGIRIIAVQDGIDTADENTKISVTVKSLVNEIFLDDLRKTTKRGMDGQFLKGFSTGGRTYGYRSEPVFDPAGHLDPRGHPIPIGYRLTIEEIEAAVVREIFRLFGDGVCEKTIAKTLNRKYPSHTWWPNTICMMLRNTRYYGLFTFNKREWLKSPLTGRRVYRLRPADQWEVQNLEALRIIDDLTWEKVQTRIRTRQHLFANRRTRTNHLLSGLLICPRCGGRYSIISRSYYGCRNHFESNACANDIRIRLEALESMILSALAQQLLSFGSGLRVATAQRRQEPNISDTRVAAERRCTALRRQADVIMSIVKSGRMTGRALEEALASYQQIWNQVEAAERETHAAPRRVDGPVEIRYDKAVVQLFTAEFREALRADVRLGREFLVEILDHVQIEAGPRYAPACPICKTQFAKVNPQHFGRHGLTLRQVYQEFPGLGFSKKARLAIHTKLSGIARSSVAA